MVQYDIVDPEEREVYIYGIELMLSTATGIILLIIVSGLAEVPSQWFPYLAGFIPLRLLGGGYHAKSHKSCILTFTLTYIICLALIDHFRPIKLSVILLSSISFFVVVLFSPVEAKNKALNKSLRTTNRRKSIFLGLFNTGITILYAASIIKNSIWITAYLTGYISSGLFMLAAVLQNEVEE